MKYTWQSTRTHNERRTNGEYEPATFSSFQRNIQWYFSEKKYSFNILKDNEFKKSRRVLAAKHNVTSSRAPQKTSCKPLERLTKTKKMLFLRQKNSATPIQLHSKELCGGFYPYTCVSDPEMRAMRTIDLMLLLLKLNMIFTATFSWSLLCDALVNFLVSTKPFC